MSNPDTLEPLVWWLLGGVVFPAWLLSGLADYILHARTDIAHTSGVHESALHLLQTAEIGLPLLVFLFLEVNAITLVLMFAAVVVHTLTSWRDLRYATPRRYIPPAEQYAHSFLNVLPWIALALVVVLHWPVARGLFDPSIASGWWPKVRDPGFDRGIVIAILLASVLFGVVPGLVEFARTLRAPQRGDRISTHDARQATKPR